MAKSIRSKCKRKCRAEFRKTIGEDFHKKNMKKIQEKLKDCVEKSSMKSLDRIADLLDQSQEDPTAAEETSTNMETTDIAVDALETVRDLTGENKIPLKASSKKRKHAMKRKSQRLASNKEEKSGPKQRPKYFVQF